MNDDPARALNSDFAGRPTLIKGDRQLLLRSMGRLSEHSVLNLKNKSHSVTAQLEIPGPGVEGVIVAQGGNIGGWALYARNGKLKYCYNLVGVVYSYVESDVELPQGEHQVRMEFAYDGGGLAKGGDVTLYIDGKQVGAGRVAATAPMVFSSDDGLDVGRDTGAAVAEDYPPRDNAFTGVVKGVELAISGAAAAEAHLISPEKVIEIALARQ